jgi:hypothetical protein
MARRPVSAPEPEPEELDEDALANLDEDDGEEADEFDLETILRAEFQDAEDYIDSDVSPYREMAARFYQGQPFGDEEDGRSQVVLTEVRDTVNAMMPNLMRIFVGGDHVVEFEPTRAMSVPQAEQVTDYVDFILDADGNSKFEVLYAAFKDALLKKLGIVTWRWEDYQCVTEHTYTGLSIGQVRLLEREPGVEVLAQEVRAEGPALPADVQLTPEQQLEIAAQMEVTVDLKIRRTAQKGHTRIEAVPPEEFVISRWAKSIDTATLVGRRRYVKVSEAIKLGADPEIVLKNTGRDSDFGINNEALIRQLNPNIQSSNSPDQSQLDVLLVEVFLRADADGDGVAELHWIRAIGSNCEIFHDEIVADVDYALFSPNPEPHAIFGLSVADDTMDIQDIKSHVLRNTLDSLASSIFPSLVVVENAVEIDDALNTEMGRVIRAKAPGMVQSLAEPFIGPQALGVLDYLDNIRASRTGQSKASQGLDPDVLQSTTRAAVTSTLAAAQERSELIARTFAETGLRRLFKGILRTITRHQDKPRTIRLRGRWVEMDPRVWDAEADVKVNPIGRTDDATKMQALGAIAQKQEQVIMTLGPDNPICGLQELRNTYADFAKLSGFKDASRYFRDPSLAPPAQAQQGQKGDPTDKLVQVELQKAADDKEVAMARLAEERRKNDMADDRERDKAETDAILKAQELLGKYGIQVNQQQIDYATQRDRNAVQERVGLHRNEIQGQVAQQRAVAPPGGPNGTA